METLVAAWGKRNEERGRAGKRRQRQHMLPVGPFN